MGDTLDKEVFMEGMTMFAKEELIWIDEDWYNKKCYKKKEEEQAC